MKRKQILTDISNFQKFIESDGYYSDKTAMIKEWMNTSGAFILVTRPRRFGKTLTLSMLRYFFDQKESSSHLYEDLEVAKDKEFCAEHMNKYPVISITFKGVKETNWENCLESIKNLISLTYKEHKEILDSLDEDDREYFNRITSLRGSAIDYKGSIKKLCRFLEKHYNKKVMLLIDEYDTPIHESFINGYYEEAAYFFSGMYGEALKDNNSVEKSLTTGILRVSKESMFSGINNLEVLTILEDKYGEYLGFSEEETKKMLTYFGREDRFEEVRDWYNGYKFGQHVMYNPWSVSNFSKTGTLKEYWINTGNAGVLYKVIGLGHDGLKDGIPKLLRGEEIQTTIEENISFKDILTKSEAAYGILLFAGYLSWTKMELVNEQTIYSLRVPNVEVKAFLKSLIPAVSGKYFSRVEDIYAIIKGGHWERFGPNLKVMFETAISYHDLDERESEKLYHMFMLGLLVSLSNEYEVKSNRESGAGRYDMALYPKDQTKEGIILEFKVADPGTNITEVLKKAMKQMEEKDYSQDLRSRGLDNVTKVAVAFRGKELEVSYKN